MARRLTRPVVSIGNLSVGGSGKTPVAALVARLLADSGERPAVLSRGYARRRSDSGVTVVSTGDKISADVFEAGDEPLMLARSLPGVPVLVCSDRYLAGRLAETRLGATVHVLDDGFQHLQLARDIDLLVVSEDDLNDRLLPSGRLREPLSAASTADAALVTVGHPMAVDRVARAIRVETVFRLAHSIAPPRTLADGESVVVPAGSRVFAVAAIARPERFFADLTAAGWELVGTMRFRDHHWFTARDVERITEAARTAGSAIVMTTEKDAVRLQACDLSGLPIASVPLTVSVDPADDFRRWLLGRLGAPAHEHPSAPPR